MPDLPSLFCFLPVAGTAASENRLLVAECGLFVHLSHGKRFWWQQVTGR